MNCRKCGCTDDRACVTDGVPCHWVAPGLCSACVRVGDLIDLGGAFRACEVVEIPPIVPAHPYEMVTTLRVRAAGAVWQVSIPAALGELVDAGGRFIGMTLRKEKPAVLPAR